MAVNRAATLDILDRFFADPALMWVTGVFTLLIGVTVIVLHNEWSGGAVPVIVTLYGWIAALKGLLFLWLPPPVQAAFYQSLHFAQYYYAYLAFGLVLGVILAYGGFKSAPMREMRP